MPSSSFDPRGAVLWAISLGLPLALSACGARTALDPVDEHVPRGPSTEVTAGDGFTCARRASGYVVCWGQGDHGQAGDGTTRNRVTPFGPVAHLDDAVQLASGDAHTCALRANGSIVCWGSNELGQLGDGTHTERASPVAVVDLVDAVEIAAGGATTCARRANGSVACWGENHYGALGDGTKTDRAIWGPVLGLDDAVSVSVGGGHTCAARSDGSVVCWGGNNEGQLGLKDGLDHTTPLQVPEAADVVQVALGAQHTCARRAAGSLSCWGSGHASGLGEPEKLVDLVDVEAGWWHTCARHSDGSVVCWGLSCAVVGIPSWCGSPLGNGVPVGSVWEPVMVLGLDDAVELAAGSSHTCAALSGGEVECWGYNDRGQLGDGTNLARNAPVSVSGF